MGHHKLPPVISTLFAVGSPAVDQAIPMAGILPENKAWRYEAFHSMLRIRRQDRDRAIRYKIHAVENWINPNAA
jgi:hypothetical protein